MLYLSHVGVKGTHWGERKYQNEDGSYKPGAEGRYYHYDPVKGGHSSDSRYLKAGGKTNLSSSKVTKSNKKGPSENASSYESHVYSNKNDAKGKSKGKTIAKTALAIGSLAAAAALYSKNKSAVDDLVARQNYGATAKILGGTGKAIGKTATGTAKLAGKATLSTAKGLVKASPTIAKATLKTAKVTGKATVSTLKVTTKTTIKTAQLIDKMSKKSKFVKKQVDKAKGKAFDKVSEKVMDKITGGSKKNE